MVALSPLPWLPGEENGKEKAKFVGQDKDSFNTIAKEENNNNNNTAKNNIQNKGIHRASLSPPNAQHAPELRSTSPQPASPPQHQA